MQLDRLAAAGEGARGLYTFLSNLRFMKSGEALCARLFWLKNERKVLLELCEGLGG